MNPKFATLLLFFLVPTGVFSAPRYRFCSGKVTGTDNAVQTLVTQHRPPKHRFTFDGEHVWVTNAGSH